MLRAEMICLDSQRREGTLLNYPTVIVEDMVKIGSPFLMKIVAINDIEEIISSKIINPNSLTVNHRLFQNLYWS